MRTTKKHGIQYRDDQCPQDWAVTVEPECIQSRGRNNYQDCHALHAVQTGTKSVAISGYGARGAEFARIVIDQQTALKLAYWIILGVEGGTPDADV